MENGTVLYEVADGVARITLNRPQVANGLDLALAQDLYHAALAADEDPAVRAILLGGAGKMFCGGGDLATFAAQGEALSGYLKEVTTLLHAAVSRFAWTDAPVVAAVQGAAAGAGFSLALGADLVVAADNAKFVLAYTKAGLTPDGSSTYYLSRSVGLHRAKELALTNRVLSAEEARDWGIVCRVVPAEELDAAALALATELAQGPTRAFGGAKRLIMKGATAELESQMERESRGIAHMSRSADAREGMDAFLNKRKPTFTGG
ncbi:MAG: enoyl-CoA hydratase/isomerase family protein [Rhodobacterales bacterium]|nr:enoyl-CoA hydratase/isomerase family protein [Rhodobacterales bacterium]